MKEPEFFANEISDVKLQNKAAAIKALFDSYDRKDLPGGYAVAVLEEGQLVFKQSYGVAHQEYEIPFTPQTRFDFASIAKQFTGYCVAGLLMQGLLSMEDNIRKFIPELPDYGPVITIQHLLGHTSGLRDWYLLVKLAGRSEDDTITGTFLMKLICRQQALNFRPGDQYAYSNSGYLLLAEVIHRVTGKTLREYAHENVFEPLGMHATLLADKENEIIKNRAAPYYASQGNNYGQGANRLAAVGCSSLFSNLDDMIKWAQYFDECVTHGDKTLNMMLTPTVLNNGKTINYNFGITKGRWRDHIFLGHGGGWNAFASEVVYFPKERVSIIFFTNRSPNHVNTYNALRQILFDEPEITQTDTAQKEPQEAKALQVNPSEIKALVGDYYSNEIQTTYTVSAKDNQLFLEHLFNEDVPLIPTGPGTFQGKTYWCEEVAFTKDDKGQWDGFYLSADSGNLMKNVRFIKLSHLTAV